MNQPWTPALTLDDLLFVEDDPELLDSRCSVTELPLWPQIRVAFFRMMMSDLLYGVRLTGTSNAAKSWTRAAAMLLRSLVHNTFQFHSGSIPARICITADGVADQWVDGQWFNRLSDHFVSARPTETLILADHFEWRWPFPRHHDRLLMHAPLQAMNTVRGKISVRSAHLQQASDLVQLVACRAQRHVGWLLDKERRAILIQMLARKTASMPWQYSTYAKMLDRIRPKLLMVGAGCYGPAASLIAAAKSQEICTAEYQHGAISAGHDAYNFAPTIRNSAVYQRTLPEHFLGYGEWWNEQINAPVRKWAIGNPHRAALKLGSNIQNAAQNDLLILSDGIEFDLYFNLACSLLCHADRLGLRIVLRPHPLERTRVLKMNPEKMAGVHIDGNVDLYCSFKTAHAVVSEVSTGLFEAIGLAKRIFVWNTPKARFTYPRHPFKVVDSIDALLEELMMPEDCISEDEISAEQVWSENWESNFNSFLAEKEIAK